MRIRRHQNHSSTKTKSMIFFEKVEDEDANLEDQTIHWFAAVICVNMAACLLLLFALSVTRIVFGELRTQELNSAKDKFWNFVFYKFIFVFGVINVQSRPSRTLGRMVLDSII